MVGNVGGMQRNTSQPLLRAPTDRVGHNGQMGGSQDWDSHNTVGMNMPSGGPMNQQNPMGKLNKLIPINLHLAN